MLRTCVDLSVQLLNVNVPALSSSSWESRLHVISQFCEFIFNKVECREHLTVL